MRYSFLELVGYERLRLNKIGYIRITPTEKLQLFLGTNGSGKSSLLRELSPLPASPADYTKEGSKQIGIEHLGSEYTLTSTFSPTQRHSFIKDGEELNPGGTATVQRELARREFNITPETHELMIGSIAFTRMGPAERRLWLTRFSDTSYSYAIGVYQKLKEKHRDILGAIKLNQVRAVQEANKLLSETQELALREEIVEYRRILNELLLKKTAASTFTDDLQRKISSTALEMKTLAQQIIRARAKFLNLEGYTSLDAINQASIDATALASRLEYSSNHIAKELESHQQTIDMLAKANLSSVSDIDAKLADLSQMIQTLEQANTDALVFDDPAQAFQALVSLQDQLTDVLTELEPNEDRRFSRERYEETQRQLAAVNNTQRGLEAEQHKLLARKKHMEDERDQKPEECPRCNYTWHKHYDPASYTQLCQQLESLGQAFGSNRTLIVQLEETLANMSRYMTLYRAYNDITRGWPILLPFWDHLLSTGLLFSTPKRAVHLIDKVKVQLKRAIQIKEYQEEVSNLRKLVALTQQDGSAHIEKLQLKVNALNEALFLEHQQLRNTQQRIQQLKTYRSTAETILANEARLNELNQQQHANAESMVESIRQSMLNELIRSVQLDLSRREQQLSQVDVQKALVENIQRQLRELESEGEILKMMVKELSPTEGLIARGLLGFINSFVRQLNSFIRKVWLYPMEILPCLPDEDNEVELDYKFGIRVNNHPKPIPDIKQASSAMSEVIDLAFRIVGMRCCGLAHAPLGLDELGHSMDSAHREMIFKTITGLITQSDFSQIFVISHFEHCYGSVTGADVLVLCDKNIVLPQGTLYNRHVEIR